MSIKVESTTEVVKESAAPVVEAKATEVDSASAAETTVEAKADETTEESEPLETDSDDDETDDERDKPSKDILTKNAKKRIDKLTKKAAAERLEKEHWRNEVFRLQQSKTQESKPEETRAQASAPTKVDGTPEPEQFENHSDYVRAIAKWEYKQEREAEKANEREASIKKEMHEKRLNFAEQAKKVAETESDYDDVMDGIDGVMIPASVQSILLESDLGARLAYELARDPKEFARVCSLAPLAAAREIGKVEARLSKDSDTKVETKETKTTKAPKPISPLGSKSTGSVKKSIHDPNLSQSEYEKLRMEQREKGAQHHSLKI